MPPLAALYLTFAAIQLGAVLLACYEAVRAFLAGQFPETQLFSTVFQFVWLPILVVTIATGVVGVYYSIRQSNLNSHALTTFAALQCGALKVDQVQLGWSAFRLSIDLNLPRLSIGCNLVGLVTLGALFYARKLSRSSRPAEAFSNERHSL